MFYDFEFLEVTIIGWTFLNRENGEINQEIPGEQAERYRVSVNSHFNGPSNLL